MHYGMQIAISGALTNLYKTDVYANNLANANTTAFKPQAAATRQRDPVRAEDGLPHLPSNAMLERLGAGVQLAPNRTEFEQGSLVDTARPFDVALQGEGFFVVRGQQTSGDNGLRLSRDGRLAANANGQLVQSATGFPIMSTNGSPIIVRADLPTVIEGDGTVRQAGEIRGRIDVTMVNDASALERLGESLFRPTAQQLRSRVTADATVRQNTLEASTVNPIGAMLAVQGATKAVSGNIAIARHHDKLMERLINQFARVS